MIVFGCYLVVALVHSLPASGEHVHSALCNTTSEDLLTHYQAGVKSFESAFFQLKNEQSQLKSMVLKSDNKCKEEISELNAKNDGLLKLQTEKTRKIYKLAGEIKEEEAIQAELEKEIKKLSNVLELVSLQSVLIRQDINVLEGRRTNGTLSDCHEVSAQLIKTGQMVEVRSRLRKNPNKLSRRTSKKDLALMTAKTEYTQKSLTNDRIKADIALSKSELLEIAETCAKKRANKIALLETIMNATQTAIDSKKYNEAALSEEKAKTEERRLSLETGKQYLSKLSKEVQQLKVAIKAFKSDVECYKSIEESL